MKRSSLLCILILSLVLGLSAQTRNDLNSVQVDQDFQKVFGVWTVQPGGGRVEFSKMEAVEPHLLSGTEGYRWYLFRNLSLEESKQGFKGSGMKDLYTLMKDPKSGELFLIQYRDDSMGPADPMRLVFRDGGRTMQIVMKDADGQDVIEATYTR